MRTPTYGDRSIASMRGPMSARGGDCADASGAAHRAATRKTMRSSPVNIARGAPLAHTLARLRRHWLRRGDGAGAAIGGRGGGMFEANAIRRVFVLALVLATGGAGAVECTGRVVLDRDGDGIAGARERGLAGVAIADGRTVVRTDREGRYRFTTAPGRTVQLVKPAGYAVPARADGLPDTWSHVAPAAAPALRHGGLRTHRPGCRDFALRRAPPRRGPLDVLLFGDPQPRTAVDVDHFRRDIVEPLLAAGASAHLGVTLGDVASDDLALLEPVKAQTVRLGLPWLHVPGNHDVDMDAASDEDSLLSY